MYLESGVERLLSILRATDRRERRGRDIPAPFAGARSHTLDELVPVFVGQADVTQQDIRAGVLEGVECLTHRPDGDHFSAASLERKGKHFAAVPIVFDEQNVKARKYDSLVGALLRTHVHGAPSLAGQGLGSK